MRKNVSKKKIANPSMYPSVTHGFIHFMVFFEQKLEKTKSGVWLEENYVHRF